jgi:hypothetical protein
MRWAGWLVGLFVIAAGCGGASRDPGVGVITTPDGGDSDGGVVDAGTPAECAGLLPASTGTAYSFDVVPSDSGQTCDPAATDGDGVVAALARGTDPVWYEFAPNYGGRSGNFGSPIAIPQLQGFLGLWGTGANLTVAHFSQGGEVENPVPLGGSAVVLAPAYAGGAISLTAGASALTVRKHGADATELASTAVPGSFVPQAAAEDAGGTVLALTGDGVNVSGFWADLLQGTAGRPFVVGAGSSALARSLPGGGIAVQVDGRWIGIAQPGQSAGQPVPSWLAGAADFALARGGKAYALLPKTGNAVGIVSLKGSSCGQLSFPGVTSVSLGVDGTVVGATGARGCTKYVWRGALH